MLVFNIGLSEPTTGSKKAPQNRRRERTMIVMWPKQILKGDIGKVGGKNLNLAELIRAGIPVPPFFALTADAYFAHIAQSHVRNEIARILASLDVNDSNQLEQRAKEIRRLIVQQPMSAGAIQASKAAYRKLSGDGGDALVAVRSSATAEDLPDDSFAGQQSTFLNVHGEDHVVAAIQACWASLFEARAAFYRAERGYNHLAVGLSAGVQRMIQSEKAGVMFTSNPVTGNPDQIEISVVYGLGEALVSGEITPDTYLYSKSRGEVIERTIVPQTRLLTMSTGHFGGHEGANVWVEVPPYLVEAPKLTDNEVAELAAIGRRVELHYGRPQDIEWAFEKGKFYITQTRPITVKNTDYEVEGEKLEAEPAELLLNGQSASPGVGFGHVRILEGPHQNDLVRQGDILVAEMTTPDYVAAMKRASAIVTERGGRTCHAAIVARELGLPCIVGAENALKALADHSVITVDGSHGDIFRGMAETRLAWGERRKERLAARALEMVNVKTRTKVMVVLADPDPKHAAAVAARNVDGVGLLRTEFILNAIGQHPRQFLADGEGHLFTQRLAEAFYIFCEAFKDKPVIVRLTDFKTHDLKALRGGDKFEVNEVNPMLGFRGAVRYMQDPEVFRLEIEAIKQVRKTHPNLWVMIPFVRTPAELRDVINLMASMGLSRGPDFKIWMMAELPSNVFLLDQFIDQGIDGLSIGSNDLTQLILGIDRDDNTRLRSIGDERNEAVQIALEKIVKTGIARGITVGICGQAPSDFPEITENLVRWGATSISVSPDMLDKTRGIVYATEQRLGITID